jgi:hypothetical protein
MLSVTNKPIMLSVIMLNVAMLSVIMLNVVMLSVIMLNVAMLSVIHYVEYSGAQSIFYFHSLPGYEN